LLRVVFTADVRHDTDFSFIYFYRNASLHYLLHLADEELTKRRKLNDGGGSLAVNGLLDIE